MIEKPDRSWGVFLMDYSKMILTIIFLHLANIVYALLFSVDNRMICQWYFINFTFDIFGIMFFSFIYTGIFNVVSDALSLDFQIGDCRLIPNSKEEKNLNKSLNNNWMI